VVHDDDLSNCVVFASRGGLRPAAGSLRCPTELAPTGWPALSAAFERIASVARMPIRDRGVTPHRLPD
jgi:spermidine synthase